MTTINGTNSSETLNGTELDDVLYGLSGNDVINGGAGNDTIVGGTGSDTINGGAGHDVMIGEGGAESYILSQTNNGNDIIKGFEFYTDRLDASAITETINITVIDSATMVVSWSGGSVTLIEMVDVAGTWNDQKLFGSTYSGNAVAGSLPGDGVWDGTEDDDRPVMGTTLPTISVPARQILTAPR